MFGFGSASKRPQYGIIIDISSGSVGIAIVESDKAKPIPRVIFSHRMNMRIGKTNTMPGERMRQMRETLFSASLLLSRDGLAALSAHNSRAKISKIFLVCSSPWAHTISRNVSYEGETDFKVGTELITDLESSAETGLEKDIDDPSLAFSADFQVVERATVDVRVNGYSVQDPLDLTGKTLSLSHVTGFILKDIIAAVEEVRDKILTNTEIQAHSAMLVSYCVFRDLFPKTSDLTLINVTGESTEIGIIEHGVLLETHSVLYGSNTLIREITGNTDQTPEYIATMLRTYSEEKLSNESRDVIDTHAKMYDVELVKLFETVHARRNIPKTIIVSAEPSVEHFVLGRILKMLGQVTGQESDVLHIKDEVLDHIVEDENADKRLAIQARFFHKLHSCGEIDLT